MKAIPPYVATGPKRLFMRVDGTGKKLTLKVSEGTRNVPLDEALQCVGFAKDQELVLFDAKHYDRIAELAWKYKELEQ